jgi:hypothetical protein
MYRVYALSVGVWQQNFAYILVVQIIEHNRSLSSLLLLLSFSFFFFFFFSFPLEIPINNSVTSAAISRLLLLQFSDLCIYIFAEEKERDKT